MQPSESIHLSSCLGPAQQVGPHSQNSKLIWGSHETAVLLFQAPLAVIAYPGIKNIWHCSIGNPLRLISIDKIENECKHRNKTGKRGWPKPFPSDRDMTPNNTANWPIPKEPKKTTNGAPSSATPRAKASFAAHPSSKPQGICLNLSTAQTISNQTRFFQNTPTSSSRRHQHHKVRNFLSEGKSADLHYTIKPRA